MDVPASMRELNYISATVRIERCLLDFGYVTNFNHEIEL